VRVWLVVLKIGRVIYYSIVALVTLAVAAFGIALVVLIVIGVVDGHDQSEDAPQRRQADGYQSSGYAPTGYPEGTGYPDEAGYEGEYGSTPEKLNGEDSYEFEPDDIERAEEADEELREYCAGAVSEAQELGCLSHAEAP
jgi:hypothetical protein